MKEEVKVFNHTTDQLMAVKLLTNDGSSETSDVSSLVSSIGTDEATTK